MNTRKIILTCALVVMGSISVFADAWGTVNGAWNQYTVIGVAPQNWGGSSGANIVIIAVSGNWVSNHNPCGTQVFNGYINMDVASGKNIYAQFLLAQVTGRKIFIQLDQSPSQCAGGMPRIVGAQLVN
jgi:hypothetical protein